MMQPSTVYSKITQLISICLFDFFTKLTAKIRVVASAKAKTHMPIAPAIRRIRLPTLSTIAMHTKVIASFTTPRRRVAYAWRNEIFRKFF